MPPSRYLGLPWRAWGETDALLTQGYAEYLARMCSCGCGQWAQDAHDPATEGRWQVHLTVCHAKAALEDFLDDHKDDLQPGMLAAVHRLADDEEPVDALEAWGEAEAAQRRTTHS